MTKTNKKRFKNTVQILKKLKNYIYKNKFLSLLLFLFVTINFLFTFTNGNNYCVNDKCGIYINGVHFHDSLWHMALASTAFQTIPFRMPVFSGYELQGYHFLFDFVIMLLSKIGISPMFSYFKIMPTLYVIFFAFLIIKLSKTIENNKVFTWILVFIMFFSSSISYNVMSFLNDASFFHKEIFAYPVSSILQAPARLLSMQYSLSLVSFIYAVILVLKDKKENLKQTILLGVLVFINLGLKFYGGLLLIFFLSIYQLLKTTKDKKIKRNFTSLTIWVVFFLLGVFVFYNPLESIKSGSTFIFSPFTITQKFIEEPYLFFNKQLTLARYYLYATPDGFSPRLLAIELYSVGLFLVHNFGLRLLGIIYLIKQTITRKIKLYEIALFATIVVSVGLTVSFIQKGGWWNTIQFCYYGAFLMNIFVAKFLYDMFKYKKVLGTILIVLFVVINIPGNIEIVKIALRPKVLIEQGEVSALKFLKKQPDGNIFTLPVIEYPYIPTLSGKTVYIGSFHVLEIVGIDRYERLKKSQLITQSKFKNRNQSRKQLKEIDAKYYYLIRNNKYYKNLKKKITSSSEYERIYQNKSVTIFKRKDKNN